MNLQQRKAFQFFLAHAGYSVPPGRTACALHMAKAEAWLDSTNLECIVQDDERAYCFCDDPTCKYHEGSGHDWETVHARIVRPCPDHGANCQHTETLASLGGIMEPDRDYLRVVRAELALEIMESEMERAS